MSQTFFEENKTILVGFIRKKIQNVKANKSEIAKDLAQDVWERMYKNYNPEDFSKGLLFKIAKRIAIDFNRKKGYNDLPFEKNYVKGELDNGIVKFEQEDRINKVFEYLCKPLTQNQESIFILKYRSQLSIEEIAERTKLSKNAVKKRLCNARKKIKENLGEERWSRIQTVLNGRVRSVT